MADIDMLTETDDDKEPQGELITVDMTDDEDEPKQVARPKDDNTAAAATRGEDDDVEVVVSDQPKPKQDRKQTPKERRALQRAARDRERTEKAQLATELATLKSTLAQLQQSGTRRDVVMIDERLADAKSRFEEAEELMATAISKGEGDAHVRLLRIRDAAAREHDELLSAKQQLAPKKEAVYQVQPQVSQQEKLHVISENTKKFQERHAWYGKDASASEVVKELDASVYAAGYDPATAAYWQELERRIKEAQEDGDIVVNARRTDQRRTPPSGVERSSRGPSSNGRSQQIFVSQARIDAMKEAGQWDDPKTRNRVLKRFAEFDRNNQSAR